MHRSSVHNLMNFGKYIIYATNIPIKIYNISIHLGENNAFYLSAWGLTSLYVFPFRVLISFYLIIRTHVCLHLPKYKLSGVGDTVTCCGLSRTRRLNKC